MPTETNIGPCECCYTRCLCANHPASLEITIIGPPCDCGLDGTGTTFTLGYLGLFSGLGVWYYASDDCPSYPHVIAPPESFYAGNNSPGFEIVFGCLTTTGQYRLTIRWTVTNPTISGSSGDDWRTRYELHRDFDLGSVPSCPLSLDLSGDYFANKFAIDLPNSGAFLPCPTYNSGSSLGEVPLTVTLTD